MSDIFILLFFNFLFMKIKKLLSTLILSGLMVSSLLSFFSLSMASAAGFSDVATDNEYYDSVQYLQDYNVVEGYSDGTYKPESLINRAEFTKIVMEVSGETLGGVNCFPDVQDEWYSKYICKATELGYVKGYPDGLFKPGQDINFAEASKIIANVLDLIAQDEDKAIWYKNYVYAMEDYAAIPTTILGVGQNINRGEMAEMIFRLEAGVSDKKYNTLMSLENNVEETHDNESLVNFRSCYALGAYMDSSSGRGNLGGYAEEGIMMDMALPPSSAPSAVTSEKAAEPMTGGGADDFSSTNVQVAGVDEADIVKTDGEYIFVLKGDTIRVVDARPASNMKEVDAVSFADGSFYATDMYVDGDRLVVLGSVYSPVVYPYPTYDFVPFGGSDQTQVYVFDISDQENIKEIRSVVLDGYYDSSRKIDGMVYVVSNQNQHYYSEFAPVDEGLVPLYKDSSENGIRPMADCTDVSYIPGPRYDSSFLVISGIPVDDVTDMVVNEVVLGNSNSVYASLDNMYITQPKYSWNNYWRSDAWGDGEETVIHKFALGRNDITYKGKGTVPGHILNQFSMDEFNGNFRIATTKGQAWDSSNPSTNNVYVLNSNMDLVGSLEGLAPGESIYSVRFVGNRGYIVTFKKVDPLFVIDLATPSAPKVLGKLKIPGFSDYLHPYDENHIIGFGKDAVDAAANLVEARNLDFAWYQGMKIAMFDVTDVENPVELHKVTIGDRGTTSELLSNHKALLFDKAKGIMAFPITVYEIADALKNDPNTPPETYGDPVFQGAYVYKVSLENGFVLDGKITQYSPTEIADKSGYYWYGDKDISRILYIGEYFYTVSTAMVKATAMSNFSDVDSVELGGESGGGNYLYAI